MMKDEDFRRLSKTISHALRHAPQLYELELDKEGYTPVAALLHSLRRHRRRWQELGEDDLQAMIVQADKQRFELKDGRIRALYGHSILLKIQKEPAQPPTILYHGTAPYTAELICEDGLRPMNRQYVHLSADRKTAFEVGRRKGKTPVILSVDAASAHGEETQFYQGNALVWLAHYIPPRFIHNER